MRRRQFLTGTVGAAGVLLAAAAGCDDGPEPDAGGAREDTIRLGMLAPLTGRNSPSGQAMMRAAQLAVREANAAGGVLGRKVELIPVDDACDPGAAVNGANSLITKEIMVSVGGYCSSATVPTMKIFRSAGIPMIVPMSNATDLIAAGYDSVFLISGTVAAEARFAVAHMIALGGRRLALVHDGTSFPLSLADATAAAVRRHGKLTVVAKLAMTQGAPSYVRIADAVLARGADVVYFTGYYTDAHQFVIDLRTRAYPGLIVVGDGSTSGPLLAGLNEHQIHDLYGTSLLMPEFMPETAPWAARYKSAYGTDPLAGTIEAYDAVVLALDAIRRAGTTDRRMVLSAIRHSQNTVLLSGPISFAADGSRTNPRFLLLKAGTDGFELASDQPAD